MFYSNSSHSANLSESQVFVGFSYGEFQSLHDLIHDGIRRAQKGSVDELIIYVRLLDNLREIQNAFNEKHQLWISESHEE